MLYYSVKNNLFSRHNNGIGSLHARQLYNKIIIIIIMIMKVRLHTPQCYNKNNFKQICDECKVNCTDLKLLQKTLT